MNLTNQQKNRRKLAWREDWTVLGATRVDVPAGEMEVQEAA